MPQATERIRVLIPWGLEDDNTLEVAYLSGDLARWKFTYNGNVDMLSLLDRDEFEVLQLVCGNVPADEVTLEGIRVIVNAVCEPDSNEHALKIVATMRRDLGVPIVNDPERVLLTTRDQIAVRLATVPGLKVPRTARINPRRRADVVPLASEVGIAPPFLVRETATHGGIGLVLVERAGADEDLERFPFDGRDLYVTEYVDFRSPDGIYRKYRAIIVGGEPFPRHMIASTEWNVHSEDRAILMDTSPELQAEEQEFLATFSRARFPAFAEIASTLGLDYVGVDFGLAGDEVVLFESNCCFRAVFGPRAREARGPSYQETTIARIKAAFGDLVRARAAETAPRSAGV